eukprot:jgi/Botrbrau1/14169/Bobra.182_3s0107.1
MTTSQAAPDTHTLLSKLQGLREKLAKKDTFEAAVCNLQSLCKYEFNDHIANDRKDEWLRIFRRCTTLLRTRYTNPSFWQAGYNLLEQAKVNISDPSIKLQLEGYLKDYESHLPSASTSMSLDDNGDTSDRRAPSAMLFEGQLTHGDHDAPVQQLDDDEQLLAETLMVLANLDPSTQPPSRPPASKRAIRSLKREILSADRLEELGGAGIQCAVCLDKFEIGNELQALPCNRIHVFHPECLAPWLAEHNSCPVCRSELETDDPQYERRKERDRIEAEDRKGAANALSHNEFMYT